MPLGGNEKHKTSDKMMHGEDRSNFNEKSGSLGMELPDVNQADLDTATVRQLFDDIAALTEIIEIIPKHREKQSVSRTSGTFEEARSLLLNGDLRALQIRYQYQGCQWWDTLMIREEGFRLVRIVHDFSASE